MVKRKLSSFWDYQIKGSQIYFLAFLVYFVPTFLNETTFAETFGDHWLRVLSYLSLPLLLFKIFFLDKWDKKQLLLILAILLLSVVTWRSAHEIELLMIAPFVIGAKDVNFRDIMIWYLYIGLTSLVLMAVFALLRIIPNLVYKSPDRPTRYSLGMNYTSEIATLYLYFSLAYCYLRFRRLKLRDYLLIVLGDIVCMKISDTKLDFIATLLLIPIMIFAQRADQGHKYSRIFASFWWIAVPVLSFLMIFSSYFFVPSSHIMRKIDALTSGRLSLGHETFNEYSITLFGRTITEHPYSGSKGLKLAHNLGNPTVHYFYIDSSYLRMLLLWGLLAFIIIVGCFTYIALRSTIRRTYVMSAIILIASINFMFEPDVIKIIYDPFLLALIASPYFYRPQEEYINEEE